MQNLGLAINRSMRATSEIPKASHVYLMMFYITQPNICLHLGSK